MSVSSASKRVATSSAPYNARYTRFNDMVLV